MKVMVETSAHHVHVTKETLEALFGKGATLTNKKNLSQPGQFACVEKVTVVGPKSEMKMSILGPERSADQRIRRYCRHTRLQACRSRGRS